MNAKQARALTEKHAPAPDIREEIRRFEGYVRSAAEEGRDWIVVRWPVPVYSTMVRYVQEQGFRIDAGRDESLNISW